MRIYENLHSIKYSFNYFLTYDQFLLSLGSYCESFVPLQSFVYACTCHYYRYLSFIYTKTFYFTYYPVFFKFKSFHYYVEHFFILFLQLHSFPLQCHEWLDLSHIDGCLYCFPIFHYYSVQWLTLIPHWFHTWAMIFVG